MTLSTIQVLEKAADYGLKLAIAPPNRVTYQPLEKCPKEFVETLRSYKPRLLSLLELPFVMVFSESLGETVFFCADEQTKAALQEAGAEPFSIYTRAELRTLCEQNRVAPLPATELKQLHQIKRTFNARMTPND